MLLPEDSSSNIFLTMLAAGKSFVSPQHQQAWSQFKAVTNQLLFLPHNHRHSLAFSSADSQWCEVSNHAVPPAWLSQDAFPNPKIGLPACLLLLAPRAPWVSLCPAGPPLVTPLLLCLSPYASLGLHCILVNSVRSYYPHSNLPNSESLKGLDNGTLDWILEQVKDIVLEI